MRYATVCSGIEAPSVAWEPLGWEPVWLSEIEPFPCAVLAHHYPTVPNHGDMTQIDTARIDTDIDVLIGGTPCQSFSVAGLRAGLSDPRGNLALVYLSLVDRLRPEWCIWENVPGVLSSGGGRDFGSILGALSELGYGWAYRVLDAQWFGVPQRRRRVFLVGHSSGDWRRAAAVLFDSESLRGNPPPCREAREEVAGDAVGRAGAEGAIGLDEEQNATVEGMGCLKARERGGGFEGAVAVSSGTQWPADVAATLRGENGSPGYADQDLFSQQGANLVPQPYPVANCLTQRMAKGINTTLDEGQTPVVAFQPRIARNGRGAPEPVCPPLHHEGGATSDARPCVAYEHYTHDHCQDRIISQDGVSPALNTSQQHQIRDYAVRRLTPVEAERLQGFPDHYTRIPWRGKPSEDCPDTPRYRALGNSMAVPVVRWIGERIQRRARSE